MARAMMPFIEGVMSTFANQMLGPDRRIAFGEQGQQTHDSTGVGLRIFAGGNQPRQRGQLVPRDPRLEAAPPDNFQRDMTAEHQTAMDDSNGQDKQLVPMDVPDIGEADARSAGDIVDELERNACGDKEAVLHKKPAGEKPAQNKLAHCTVTLKRPSAAATVHTPAAKKKPAGKSFKLGCSRCKGSKMGCLTCRNPAYTGRRWQK